MAFFGIFAAINAFCIYVLPSQIDLTWRGTFTLAPQTRNLLAALHGPVEITVLAPKVPKTALEHNFRHAAQMLRDLVENCRRIQPLLHMQELAPTESAQARQLQQQFPDLLPPCVLITLGSAGHEVLYVRDLAEFHPGDASRPAQVEFFGEQSLAAALARLTGGTKQALIYVINGHGELALDDADAESRQGMGLLAGMLRELDCELKPLDLGAVARIPHDASLVIVAGGEKSWGEAEADKLGKYLRQAGKALVLVELNYDSRLKGPAPLGLEELLSEFGVAVGSDRVVTRGFTGQIEAASLALPAGGDHPLVRSLPQSPLTLFECRSLMSSAGVRQVSSSVVPLLVSHAAPRAWAEGDFGSRRPAQPGGANDSDGPVPMAVAVERRGEAGAEPALVVVGDAEFLSNRVLAGPAGRANSSFVLSCINWLRGRRELLGDIPPRRHEGYRLAGSPDDVRGLVWKSGLALWALIATAGITVWTTRRIG
jgi:ABC-type uncharacterized transport system involved in gliding motility auxiliary subunit